MSGQNIMATSSFPNPNVSTVQPADIIRRTANFQPSIWGDHFISLASNSMESSVDGETNEEKLENLKEVLRRMIVATVENPLEKLDLIDSVQRLGVSYHFENEIEVVLQQVRDSISNNFNNNKHGDDDLYTVALCFRLLRQQGYNISCDMFNKFKNNEGKFKESIASDVQGMLSLHEATHLRVHEENILDEALSFTTSQLNSLVSNHLISCPILMDRISHALKQPIRKGITRLEARHYMSVYQLEPSHNKVLFIFAKLDFNLLQKAHQEELSHIARWWKELDFANKLPFARDRVIECYFWILGFYFEPQYAFARKTMTKVIAMTSIIDDIYDVYGTLEELELFTEAIKRWDISAIDMLPEYMQFFYKALLDVYSEIGEELANQEGKLYRLDYAKEAMKRLIIRGYFQEAKWFHSKYVPTMEEYMQVALLTSGYEMLSATSFLGMGEIVTKESFEWLFSNPKIVSASEVLGRLMNDIVSHKFEQKRGDVASAVECYMKQYGATEEEAVKQLREQISSAWKDINEECLYPTIVPMPLLMRILNNARVTDVVYKNKDGYTNAGVVLKDFITSILIDPISE